MVAVAAVVVVVLVVVHKPLSLPPRRVHLHRHLLGRFCRLRVRRGAVCSSFPSVCRPPSVENHVFQWGVSWCVARGAYRASLRAACKQPRDNGGEIARQRGRETDARRAAEF